MPFKSQAQRRKFAQLLVEGRISNETFEEWNRETGGAKLPERVTRKAGAKAKARPKTKARPKARARTRVKAKRKPAKAAGRARRPASKRKTK